MFDIGVQWISSVQHDIRNYERTRVIFSARAHAMLL